MRIARKIMLLAGLALAAMAFAAGSASAQEEPVEVVNEITGEPCDPCAVHVEGEARFRIHGTTTEITRCIDEFHANIYHDGSGEIEWERSADVPVGPGCNSTNCNAPENHWPIQLGEAMPSGALHLNVRFCLSGSHCDAEVAVTEPVDHVYRFNMDAECPSSLVGQVEVVGTWQTEHDLGIDDEIEVSHL